MTKVNVFYRFNQKNGSKLFFCDFTDIRLVGRQVILRINKIARWSEATPEF